LINTEAKRAKTKEKEFNLNDGDGLALRVKPNGSKLWISPITALTPEYARPLVLALIQPSHLQKPEIDVNLHWHYCHRIQTQKNFSTKMIECTRVNSNILKHIAAKWLKVKNQRYQKTMPLIPGAL
jgi:hypothetical protein